MRRLLSLAVALVLGTAPTLAPAQAVRTVAVAPSALTLTVGDTAVVTATPQGPSGKKLSAAVAWSTAQPTRLSVARAATAKGRLVALDTGAFTVYATAGGVTGRTTGRVLPRVVPPPVPVDTPATPPAKPDTAPTAPPPVVDTGAVVAATPALPLELATPVPVVTGRTWRPLTAEDLRHATSQAQPGDEILLRRGVDYVGYLFLPRRTGAGWVTVRTDSVTLPAGVRVDSATARRERFARLVAQGRNDPAIMATNGSGGWRFHAVEITVADSVRELTSLVLLGDNTARTLAEVPADFVFDRTYIHGTPHVDMARCLALNVARAWVLHSTVTECHSRSWDSNAIGVWAGPGPIRLEGNAISGSGMGVFIGGGDPQIAGLIPSDVVIRRNHIYKPKAWQAAGWAVKNLVETKNAHRVLIEGNVIESTWPGAQVGFAFVLKSTNQEGGAPWSQTADVTIRYNLVHDAPHGLGINARPEQYPATPIARVLVHDNVFTAIGGRLVQLGEDLRDVALVRNTVLDAGSATGPASHGLIAYIKDGAPMQRLVLRDNLWSAGAYGWFGDGGTTGTRALAQVAGASWAASGNVLVGEAPGWLYPTGTRVAATLAAVGFVNPAAGDFTLMPASPFLGVGADVARVRAATAGVR